MKIEKIKISDLKFFPGNPRKFTDEMMERLVKSIREFGFVEPLVINNLNEVIGGNHRLKAAAIVGLEEVPCHRVNLDKIKEKILNIALNRIHGDFDFPMLKDLIVEIDTGEFDIELTGFDMPELENIFSYDANNDAIKMPELSDIKEPTKGSGEDLTLSVIFDNENQLNELFNELNDRGYKVKR